MKLAIALIFVLATTAWPQTTKSPAPMPNNGNLLPSNCTESPEIISCNGYQTVDGRTIPGPIPEWVPDPSAGHYDCRDGYTAMVSAEPAKWHSPYIANAMTTSIPMPPPMDKKGHALASRPDPPKCIQDQP